MGESGRRWARVRKFVVLSLLLVAGILWKLFSRRARNLEQPVTPQEIALGAMEALPEEPVARVHALAEAWMTYLVRTAPEIYLGKTVAELCPSLEDEELASMLELVEQVRFSNRVPDGFCDRFEAFIRDRIRSVEEEEGA